MNEPIGCALCGGNNHNADECKRFAGERERFEAELVVKHGYQPKTLRGMRHGERYISARLNLAWGSWQARSAQPAPVVPEGYVLVPKSMWVDAASIEALAFVMGGPEEDDGSPTYCDCVMWVGEIDDDGVKRHGIHVYNTECEEEGSTTLAEFAAAPAQGQQVECQECERLRSELFFAKSDLDLCRQSFRAERNELEQDRDEAQSGYKELSAMSERWIRERDQLRAELSALKAQQEPVAWRVTGAGGLTVTPEYPKWAEDDSRLLIESLYTAPQPAPAQDVADDLRELLTEMVDIHRRRGVVLTIHIEQIADILAAHDKQSGGAE